MAAAVAGTRRIVVVIGAMFALGIAVPAVVHADPPPPTPHRDVLNVQNSATAPQRANDYELGVPLIGVNAWVAITNQVR